METIEKFVEVCSVAGYGSGYGSGSGSGSGLGYGSGLGDGWLFGTILNSQRVYNIDNVATVIDRVYQNYAKGAIVNEDLTLTPCYIAKHGNLFAHGDTLREAAAALNDKLFEDMPEDERIKAFREKFKPDASYPNEAFYEWHNKLTGSCKMGRDRFVKEHGIDLKGSMTVKEFIKLTRNDFGGGIIKKLERFYKEERS